MDAELSGGVTDGSRDGKRFGASGRDPARAGSPSGPAGRELAGLATVHVDLDGASHIFRVHGWNWKGGPDLVYTTGVPRALDTFDALGIRATFFAIAEDLDDPEKAPLLREIVARGHEIASHSLTHARLRGLDPAAKRSEIYESRARLSASLGVEPRGFRAPWFSIDAASLGLLAEAGYAWDSSIIAGRAVPGVTGSETRRRAPWVVEPSVIGAGDGAVQGASTLIELPLPMHRPLPLPFHPSYSLILGFRYFERGLAAQRRHGAPLVLLFHLIDFADPLPAAVLHGWRQRIFTLSHIGAAKKRDACRRMLDAVRAHWRVVATDTLLAAADNEAGRMPE